MKTILATGAAGFIGSNFVRHILKKYPKYRIIVLDALTYAGCMDNVPRDPRVQFVFGNVCNSELVNKLITQVDTVVHFAAESHVTRSIFDNLLFFETDVLGTQAVANAVAEHGKHIEKFVHISTSEVYGSAKGNFMTEEDLLLPASPYAAAKAGADRLVYAYWNTYGIPAITLRPFNNFGKMQHLEKLIPRFITSCILNEPLNIHGDGTASRDWVYVDDTCNAIDLALHCDLDKGKGQVINIGSGRSIDIITIAKMVIKLMGRDESLIHYIEDRPGQVERHTADANKASELLGWTPTICFEEGLERTIAWYKKNPAWWKRQLWMRSIPIITKDGKKVVH
jgi:dTDP-glucose 4,6-dehydratase